MLTQVRQHRQMSPSIFITLILFLTYAAADTKEAPPPTPNATIAPPPPVNDNLSSPPFKPGIAVMVCVLTTIISLTSLLLLYIKHCNSGTIDAGGGNSIPWTAAPFAGRKNSGIERSVVESLPVFRFGALRGQKEGLDCAVCLMKFEAAEVLRLLPKCKHAFHVECVDTWLDAHSTCPLCRYRVDPEDILLVEDGKGWRQSQRNNSEQECAGSNLDLEKQEEIVESRRRHSSVGERERETTEEQGRRWTTAFRMSLDSATKKRNNESVVGVGCFVRPRKDGMLLTQDTERDRRSVERRLEHRIIVSPGPGIGVQQRWSDVQASDLLYLTSEMIMSEARWNNRRGGRRKRTRRTNDDEEGRGIINGRSVSEITGLSRFSSSNTTDMRGGDGEREEGLVRRWLGWISKSRTQPAVR